MRLHHDSRGSLLTDDSPPVGRVPFPPERGKGIEGLGGDPVNHPIRNEDMT